MENNQPLYSYGQTVVGLFSMGAFRYHFNPDGFYGGKNSWLSDDSTIKIIWDTTLNAWKLSGTTLGTTQVINTNPAYPPINGNWSVLGQSYNVAANSGLCVAVDALSSVVNKNDPKCKCDGSINVAATGGVPPYQYSYNNGVTYLSGPIMSNLCGGDFYVIVKDSVGTTVTKMITLSQVIPKKEYVLTLDYESDVLTGVNTWESTYVLIVEPPLPSGVEITFEMNLSNRFVRTPYDKSAIATFEPQVIKNTQIIDGINNEPLESTIPNSVAGCQSFLRYITDYDTIYSGLKIKSGDVYTIKTVRNYVLNCNYVPPAQLALNGFGDELGPLSYGMTSANLYAKSCCNAVFNARPSNVANLSISGCDCCSVTSGKSLYE
jgi:hypothetical protein